MNTLFPELLFLGPFFAPALIRIALACIFLFFAWSWYKEKRSDASSRIRLVLFTLSGVLLFLGFATQLAALLAFLLAIDAFFFKTDRKPLIPKLALILIAVMALSLIVTGAGAFAIDLPY
jgi:uncharacterized membrane protein YphA (DoxX/SURF4 family)